MLIYETFWISLKLGCILGRNKAKKKKEIGRGGGGGAEEVLNITKFC